MLDPTEKFYFYAALNPTSENFPLFYILSFYTALLSDIISLTYTAKILQMNTLCPTGHISNAQ
jgi:hypothetical protein